MKINGTNIFQHGKTPKSLKNELYNQGFKFIKNPFDDWMDDLEPI